MPHVVDAGEAPTPDARGHTMHACSPGQRVPLRAEARDAALAPEELVADVDQFNVASCTNSKRRLLSFVKPWSRFSLLGLFVSGASFLLRLPRLRRKFVDFVV